jgi:hypothetical protein
MAEPTLDDDQRHLFASHLDAVWVPELMRANRHRTPAAAAMRRKSDLAAAVDNCRPRVARR